jgi:hypothetical protein
MKKFFLLSMVLMVLLSWGIVSAKINSHATPSVPTIVGQGGPDAFGYHWIDNDSAGGPTYNWIDISGYGTQVTGLGDDNNVGPFPFGFEFPYYWYTIDHCWIGSNGYIEFLTNTNISANFDNIPNPAHGNDYMAVLCGDLDFSRGNGTCYYYTNNVDTFIVSWINVCEYQNDPNNVDSVHTFQVILSARDTSITYQYGPQVGSFGLELSDVIGIENVNGQVGLQYLYNNAPVGNMFHDGLATRYYPIPNPNFVVHDAGMLNAFVDGSGAQFIPNNTGYAIRGELKDFGNQVEAGISVSCIIKRGTTTVYHDTIPAPSLNPSQTAWLDFPDPFTPTTIAQYLVTFRTIMTGEQNRANDTLNAELEAFTLPQKLANNDNVGETHRSWTGDFSGFAQEFQMPVGVRLDTAYVDIGSVTAPGNCYIWVLPDDGTGHPDGNNRIAGDTVNVTAIGWITVDLTASNLTFAPNAKFWIVEVHALVNTIGFEMDQTRPMSYRGWEFTGVYAPDRDRQISDIMIDAYCEAYTPPPGTLAGVVTDNNSAFLPNVFVTVWTPVDDTEVGIDTTNTDGTYSIPLAPGTFRAQFDKAGFRDTSIQDIVINSSQTTTLNVQMFPPSGCAYRPGDINNNGSVNGVDIVYAVNYLKGTGAPPPVDCGGVCPEVSPFYAAGDVNGNCAFNGIDITFFVRYLKGQVPSLLTCADCPPAR